MLGEYGPYLLDQMIAVVAAACLTSYAFYTIAPETVDKYHSERLTLTIPFVIYGIFRYLYLVHRRDQGGDPGACCSGTGRCWLAVALWAARDGRDRVHGTRDSGTARANSARKA